MRHHGSTELPPPTSSTQGHSRRAALRNLAPYLWQYRARVLIALLMLVAAKVANVGVPVVLKDIVNALDVKPGDARAVLVVPVALLVAYGALRLCVSLFTELREIVFSRVTQGAVRKIALEVFDHLFSLPLRYHLERQTGGMSRDIERGTRGISSLVSYTLYSILPTLVEMTLVIGILMVKYDWWFAGIALVALALYIGFTVVVTEWRTNLRRTMNEQDSRANQRAVDALLNYETVKIFGNEAHEARRYDENLHRWMTAAVKSQNSLSLLNLGQSFIIAVAVTLLVWRATAGVVSGTMNLGDLVLVNAFMIQLYAPLNFLGVIYREIRQSLTDIERMFIILEQNRDIADAPDAKPLVVSRGTLRFEDVHFGYAPGRQVLRGLSFELAGGETLAIVGPSGAGKSTLSRLLFRFYDVDTGRITIDGQDIAKVSQASLRAALGLVPQDTVLFNDTIGYNIAYGRPGASQADVEAVARAAQIHDFIVRQPLGYETQVGERGLKLSGGEKQRVAIARALLKNPPVLIFDEATSQLDSANEKAIQGEIRLAARNRTTLIIAHRLSTVVDAHQILVLDDGRIKERGTHAQLLELGGVYARMWALQQEQANVPQSPGILQAA
ncbi:ABC transporter ATP-binding protein/permease [Thiomonas sp. FB-Cd]|uniref:ABCB family ABC transporter ATP-binding protein/permease n=1 Tax=Thiomonas sp. FB-Cd TaxID=1158292 RepID=UPI0004DF4E81|nr:ABC transporter ATP-binding protein/permease [Thiomonas sp. FB-Cd]